MRRFMTRQRIQRTPEQQAAKAADDARKALLRKECQVCGSMILANKGAIAHHGYKRPGWGYQTSSCFGARELPFEADKTKAEQWLQMTRDMLELQKEKVQGYRAEKIDLERNYEKKEPGAHWTAKGVKTRVLFNRGNFDLKKAEHPAAFHGHYADNFDDFLARTVKYEQTVQSSIESEIKRMVKRLEGWKARIFWDDGEWSQIMQMGA